MRCTHLQKIRLAFFTLLLFTVTCVQAVPFLNSTPSVRLELEPKNKTLEQTLAASLQANKQNYGDLSDNANMRSLERAETTIISKQLRAEGYYAHQLQRLEFHHYHIELGPRFTIGSLSLHSSTTPSTPWPTLPLQAGQPLRAIEILTSQQQLLTFLREHCYPDASVDYKVTLDATTQQADVLLKINTGTQVAITDIRFSGQQTISENYLHNHANIKRGQCMRTTDLDRARVALLQTGLLTNVRYHVEQSPTDANNANATLIFDITERKQRSIKASVGYTRDAGIGTNAGWENRNLWGDGEQLLLETGLDDISTSASSTLTLPSYRHPNQQLQFSASAKNETPDAYSSEQQELSSTLSRDWSDILQTSVGLAFTQSRIDEDDQIDTFQLLSLPMTLNLDHSDNKINPRDGWSAGVSLRPFVDIAQDNLQFLQTVISLRRYFTNLDWRWQPTLAVKASAGALTGANLDSIPADQRFYVGGGGSVRGYAYQSAGELTDGDPDGGKSFADTSVELRLRILESWELVTFTDGGYAYADNLPKFGSNFLWSAGLGVRYYTRFAPIRFDIAVPLDKREGIDDSLQVYISFGQAF